MFGRPAVELGTHCACCNVETTRTVTYRRSQPQVYVPCCDACRRHVLSRRVRLPVAVLLAALCAGCVVISPWFLLPASIFVWIALTTPLKRVVFARDGHQGGLRVRLTDQEVRIGTTNPRFAETLRALHPS